MTATASLLAAVTPLVVGAVLLWSGGLKVFGGRSAEVARRTALGKLVGSERAPLAYGVVGAVELLVATALLLPVTAAVRTAGVGAAVALSAGFVAYLAYARVVAPESSCGCLSEKTMPVRGRSIVRAVVLLGLAAAGGAASSSWVAAWTGRPVAGSVVAVAALAVLAALSPELDRHWLLPLRRLRLRLSHPLASTATDDVPVEASVYQLERSPAHTAAVAWLRSDLLDSWEEDDWRVLTYGASYADRPVTAVFAVPRLRYEPEAVRGVLVDESGAVVWEHRSALVPA